MRKYLLAAVVILTVAAFGAPSRTLAADGLPNAMDRQFVAAVGPGNSAEIALSKVAISHASRPAVRRFAIRMVADHSALGPQFAGAVRRSGLWARTTLDAKHRAILRRLRRLSGPSFDQAYMSAMLADHTATVDIFQQEIDHGTSSPIRNFAVRNVGTIQGHLQMAGDLVGKTAVANRIKSPMTNKM